MKIAIFGTLMISLFLASSMQVEAKNGFYPTNFNRSELGTLLAAEAPVQSKLVYYGGPVISHVKAYAVFWGPNVNANVKSNIGEFYSTVTNSSYLDWLDEYNTTINAQDGRAGTQQHIGRGTFAGAITITPANTATTIDDVDIQAEIQHQIDSGKLPKPDEDTLYMTYFPPGITITAAGMKSCSEFCAYHGFKGAPDTAHFYYGVMPDLGGACVFGCGFANPFNVMTAISSHELMEAITDPFPTPGSTPAYPQAWNTTDGSEVGDLCAGSNNTLAAAKSGKTFTVQSEWDNNANACTTASWQAP